MHTLAIAKELARSELSQTLDAYAACILKVNGIYSFLASGGGTNPPRNSATTEYKTFYQMSGLIGRHEIGHFNITCHVLELPTKIRKNTIFWTARPNFMKFCQLSILTLQIDSEKFRSTS